jgi:RES domain-containing protein
VIVTAYRITKAAHASAIWSGIGAQTFPGRWNSKGVAVVYTAQSRSLAAIEQLVHLSKPRALRGFVLASISFDDSGIRWIDPASLPVGWDDPVAPAFLKKMGDDWIGAGKDLALAVPSAVIAGEWNYLLNPAHPEFVGLLKSTPEPFVFDRRLG